MTEIRKGWPWGRALPARVGWYREALALKAPGHKPGASNGSEHQDNDEVGRAEVDHGQTPNARRTSAITAQGASAKASRSSKRF